MNVSLKTKVFRWFFLRLKKRFLYLILCSTIFYTILTNWLEFQEMQHNAERSANQKYILIWTSPTTEPFTYLGNGRENFEKRQCPFTNCFVTSNRNYLADITEFDAVLFHGPELNNLAKEKLPQKRSPRQKYIFASIESSHNYPVCSPQYNGFFNWTWTYRLDSDARWGYVAVLDINATVIGPNQEMRWPKMTPIKYDVKKKLKTKSKAVAWFTSYCKTKSKRMELARKIDKALSRYNYSVDIFGKCGADICPPENDEKCYAMLENDYYFYLSFENSFSEDYVTEKILTALKHNVVPIVYGYANYTRFMPAGIYLDATKTSADLIAISILTAIKNPEVYYEYFKWKNHLIFQTRNQDLDTNEYCNFCKILNNRTAVEANSVYENFIQWWNTKYEKTC